MRGWLAATALLSGMICAAQRVDVNDIIRRSVEVDDADWQAAPDYNHFERDREADGTTKTYKVEMILGSDYHRLTAVDSRPLPPDREREEQRKESAEIARRQRESAEERAERIAKYQRERKRDHRMMQQLTRAFHFRFIGEQELGPFHVWVLEATPRPGYEAPDRDSEALKGMRGKLWIDPQTYQWVRVEAEVFRPVRIKGFLAEVEPGTRFELEKAPAADGVWLPTHFAMRSHARVLLLFHRRERQDETYWGYQRTAEGPLTDAPPR